MNPLDYKWEVYCDRSTGAFVVTKDEGFPISCVYKAIIDGRHVVFCSYDVWNINYMDEQTQAPQELVVWYRLNKA